MTGRGKLIVAVAVGALLLGRAQIDDTPIAQSVPVQEPAPESAVRADPAPPSQAARRPRQVRVPKARQEPAPRPAAPERKRKRERPPVGAPRTDTWRVVDIVDGDTIDVRRGDVYERVRVIGIDTPERGDCGFDEASSTLSRIVLGSAVTLSPGAVDDRDRYDRLLRYVDVRGEDAGLALIEAGLAIARYDSRDGYGAHPREAAYVRTDAATKSAVCRENRPAPVAQVPAPSSGEAFENCTAARDAGAAPVHRGDPGYGSHLDGDDDGVGCE